MRLIILAFNLTINENTFIGIGQLIRTLPELFRFSLIWIENSDCNEILWTRCALDITTLNTMVGVVGIVVGVIGIVIGIIGFKSLNTATRITNKISADNNSTIQQAQVIRNGLDDYAVIKLSRATTREELEKIVERIQPIEDTVSHMPRFHYGNDEPKDHKEGDLWLRPFKNHDP